jgi:hypothetical protein
LGASSSPKINPQNKEGDYSLRKGHPQSIGNSGVHAVDYIVGIPLTNFSVISMSETQYLKTFIL